MRQFQYPPPYALACTIIFLPFGIIHAFSAYRQSSNIPPQGVCGENADVQSLLGYNDAIQVDLFESILRDGEQGARKTFSPESKGHIAHLLEEDMKAMILDIGLPGASPLDFEGARKAVQSTRNVKLSALAHGTPAEISIAARALRGAEHRSRIATFHRPMEISSRYSEGGKSTADVEKRLLKMTRRAVKVASDFAPEVQYYLVYAGNRRPSFLAELAREASSSGATHITIADSQSALTPSRAHSLTSRVKDAIDDDAVTIAIHCHNQMGLALPNTLASIKAGARQVESCLLGIGDAGGNLATEQFLAYCEHFNHANTLDDKEDLFPICTVDGYSLPAAVSLAGEVSHALGKFFKHTMLCSGVLLSILFQVCHSVLWLSWPEPTGDFAKWDI